MFKVQPAISVLVHYRSPSKTTFVFRSKPIKADRYRPTNWNAIQMALRWCAENVQRPINWKFHCQWSKIQPKKDFVFKCLNFSYCIWRFHRQMFSEPKISLSNAQSPGNYNFNCQMPNNQPTEDSIAKCPSSSQQKILLSNIRCSANCRFCCQMSIVQPTEYLIVWYRTSSKLKIALLNAHSSTNWDFIVKWPKDQVTIISIAKCPTTSQLKTPYPMSCQQKITLSNVHISANCKIPKVQDNYNFKWQCLTTSQLRIPMSNVHRLANWCLHCKMSIVKPSEGFIVKCPSYSQLEISLSNVHSSVKWRLHSQMSIFQPTAKCPKYRITIILNENA